MKVFINPGHGSRPDIDPGATANGLYESVIAKEVGDLVEHYLNTIGIETYSVQSDSLNGEASEDTIPVIPTANDWEADIFVSIHCNAANGIAKGTETLHYPGSTESIKLARFIQSQIIGSLHTVDRGLKERPNLAVLKYTDMPAVLVELAFIDNPDDANLLANNKDDFARAIARGITDYQLGVSSLVSSKQPSISSKSTPVVQEVAPTNNSTTTNPKKIMNRQNLAIEIAKGIIATGIEGSYDSISCSTKGNRPAIGVSQWEYERADELLKKIPGAHNLVGESYSSLSVTGGLGLMKQLLASESGRKAQLELLADDCLNKYVPMIQLIPECDDTRVCIYIGMWMPTSHYIVNKFLVNRINRINIHSLKEVHNLFYNEYADAAGVPEYSIGYQNRAMNTFKYVTEVDLTTDYNIPWYGKGVYGE